MTWSKSDTRIVREAFWGLAVRIAWRVFVVLLFLAAFLGDGRK